MHWKICNRCGKRFYYEGISLDTICDKCFKPIWDRIKKDYPNTKQ